MDKQLVILGEDGRLGAYTSGPGPYDAVRVVDARQGMRGEVYTFSQDWAGLLEQAYGPKLPSYIHFDVREVPASENVALMIEYAGRLINQIRQEASGPFSVPVSDDGRIAIEFQPSEHDSRVVVACRFMGDTVVNYTDDGLLVDVFSASDALTPKHSMQFSAEELMGEAELPGYR